MATDTPPSTTPTTPLSTPSHSRSPSVLPQQRLSVDDNGRYVATKQTLKDAGEVYVLMPDRRSLSRSDRALWVIRHLNKPIRVRQLLTKESLEAATDVVIVSVIEVKTSNRRSSIHSDDSDVASLGPKGSMAESKSVAMDLEDVDNGEEWILRPWTNVFFIGRCYRIVFSFDVSPSMATTNNTYGGVLFDELYESIEYSMTQLLRPFRIPGSDVQLLPKVFLSVITRSPTRTEAQPIKVLLQGKLITPPSLWGALRHIRYRLAAFERQLSEGSTSLAYENYFLNEDGRDDRGTVEPAGTIVGTLHDGIFALNLLPKEAIPVLIVVTDGVTLLPDSPNPFNSVLTMCNRQSITCSFIQVGGGFHPDVAFGYVPDTELLHFVAVTTGGAFFYARHLNAKGVDATYAKEGSLNHYESVVEVVFDRRSSSSRSSISIPTHQDETVDWHNQTSNAFTRDGSTHRRGQVELMGSRSLHAPSQLLHPSSPLMSSSIRADFSDIHSPLPPSPCCQLAPKSFISHFFDDFNLSATPTASLNNIYNSDPKTPLNSELSRHSQLRRRVFSESDLSRTCSPTFMINTSFGDMTNVVEEKKTLTVAESLNVYHRAFFALGASGADLTTRETCTGKHTGVPGFADLAVEIVAPNTLTLQSMLAADLHSRFPWKGVPPPVPVMRSRFKSYGLKTALIDVVAQRLREGYVVDGVDITGGGSTKKSERITVRMILLWKQHIKVEYCISSSGPLMRIDLEAAETAYDGEPTSAVVTDKTNICSKLSQSMNSAVTTSAIESSGGILSHADGNSNNIASDSVMIPATLDESTATEKQRLSVRVEINIISTYTFLRQFTGMQKGLAYPSGPDHLTGSAAFRLLALVSTLHESDRLITHLHTFSDVPAHYSPPAVVRATSLFYLPPDANAFAARVTSGTSISGAAAAIHSRRRCNGDNAANEDDTSPSFTSYWTVVAAMGATMRQRCLDVHQIVLLVDLDPQHASTMLCKTKLNGEFKVASYALPEILRTWSSFVLVERQAYVRFLGGNGVIAQNIDPVASNTVPSVPPTGYCVLYLQWESPCLVVLRLGFVSVTWKLRMSTKAALIEQLRSYVPDDSFFPDNELAKVKSIPSPSCCSPGRPMVHVVRTSLRQVLVRYGDVSSEQPDASSTPDVVSGATSGDPLEVRRNIALAGTTQLRKTPLLLLLSYLEHRRWVWDVSSASRTAVEPTVASIVIESILRSRLREGFRFSLTLTDIFVMVREIDMVVCAPGRPSETVPTTIQYVLLPPTHQAGRKKQVVTELWVEPQSGVVDSSTNKIFVDSHYMVGLSYLELFNAVFTHDLNLVASLTTFDFIMAMTRPSGPRVPPPSLGTNTNEQSSYDVRLDVKHISTTFSLRHLLFSASAVVRYQFPFFNNPSTSHLDNSVGESFAVGTVIGESFEVRGDSGSTGDKDVAPTTPNAILLRQLGDAMALCCACELPVIGVNLPELHTEFMNAAGIIDGLRSPNLGGLNSYQADSLMSFRCFVQQMSDRSLVLTFLPRSVVKSAIHIPIYVVECGRAHFAELTRANMCVRPGFDFSSGVASDAAARQASYATREGDMRGVPRTSWYLSAAAADHCAALREIHRRSFAVSVFVALQNSLEVAAEDVRRALNACVEAFVETDLTDFLWSAERALAVSTPERATIYRQSIRERFCRVLRVHFLSIPSSPGLFVLAPPPPIRNNRSTTVPTNSKPQGTAASGLVDGGQLASDDDADSLVFADDPDATVLCSGTVSNVNSSFNDDDVDDDVSDIVNDDDDNDNDDVQYNGDDDEDDDNDDNDDDNGNSVSNGNYNDDDDDDAESVFTCSSTATVRRMQRRCSHGKRNNHDSEYDGSVDMDFAGEFKPLFMRMESSIKFRCNDGMDQSQFGSDAPLFHHHQCTTLPTSFEDLLPDGVRPVDLCHDSVRAELRLICLTLPGPVTPNVKDAGSTNCVGGRQISYYQFLRRVKAMKDTEDDEEDADTISETMSSITQSRFSESEDGKHDEYYDHNVGVINHNICSLFSSHHDDGGNTAETQDDHCAIDFPSLSPVTQRDPLTHLRAVQRMAVRKTAADIAWLLADETTAAARLDLTVTRTTISAVIRHVSSKSIFPTAASTDIVPLLFVQEAGRSIFDMELSKLRLDGYRLCQPTVIDQVEATFNDDDETLFYVSREKSSIETVGECSDNILALSLPVWLIVRVSRDEVLIYFHTRDWTCSVDSEYRQLLASVRFGVARTVKHVNQLLLLKDLHDTRLCSSLLIPPSEDDIWAHDDSERRTHLADREIYVSGSKGGLARVLFRPGQFECRCVFQTHIPLHWRLHSPLAMRAITAVLEPFSVSNRQNLFVYEEKSGAVFYLRLSESLCSTDDMTTSPPYSVPRRRESISSIASTETAISVRPSESVIESTSSHSSSGDDASGGGLNDDNDSPNPRSRYSSQIISTPSGANGGICTTQVNHFSSSLTNGGLSGAGFSQSRNVMESVVLEVYGVSDAGPEITEQLVELLANRLRASTLSILSTLLARNVTLKLTPADVQFLQPRGQAPAVDMVLPLKTSVIADIPSFLVYLRQNLLQFLHAFNVVDAGTAASTNQQQNINITHEQHRSVPEQCPPPTASASSAWSVHSSEGAAPAPINLSTSDFSTKEDINEYVDDLGTSFTNTGKVHSMETSLCEDHIDGLISFEPLVFIYNCLPSPMQSTTMAAIGQGMASIRMELTDASGNLVTRIPTPSPSEWTALDFTVPIDHVALYQNVDDSHLKMSVSEQASLSRYSIRVCAWTMGSVSQNALSQRLSACVAQAWVDYCLEMNLRFSESHALSKTSDIVSIENDSSKNTCDLLYDFVLPCTRYLVHAHALQSPSVHFVESVGVIPRYTMDELLHEIVTFINDLCPGFVSRTLGEPCPVPFVESSRIAPTMRQCRTDHNYNKTANSSEQYIISGNGLCWNDSTMLKYGPLDFSSLQLHQSATYNNDSESEIKGPLATRHCFVIISMSTCSVSAWAYNWLPSLHEKFDVFFSRLLSWHALRMRMLSNILHQKMGLFQHVPFTTNISQIPSDFGSQSGRPFERRSTAQNSNLHSNVRMTMDNVDLLIRNPVPHFQRTSSVDVTGGSTLTSNSGDSASVSTPPGGGSGPSMLHKPPHLIPGYRRSAASTSTASSANPSKLGTQGFASILKSCHPRVPMHLSTLWNLEDPVLRHGIQFQQTVAWQAHLQVRQARLRTIYDSWYNNRYSSVTSPGVPNNSSCEGKTTSSVDWSTQDQRLDRSLTPSLVAAKRTSRIIHCARIPLLFSNMRKRLFLVTGDSARAGAAISQAEAPSVANERVWYAAMLEQLQLAYRTYLESLGLTTIYVRKARPPSDNPEAAANGSKRNSSQSSTALHELPRRASRYVLQKVFSGGAVLVEVSFQGLFMAVNLYSLEYSRLRLLHGVNDGVSSSDISTLISPITLPAAIAGELPSITSARTRMTRRFASECAKLKEFLHTNSFVYDFHLRTFQSFLTDERTLFPRWCLLDMLNDFLLYYPSPANYARSRIQSGKLVLSDDISDNCDSDISSPTLPLFEYIVQHASRYGFQRLLHRGIADVIYVSSSRADFLSGIFSSGIASPDPSHSISTRSLTRALATKSPSLTGAVESEFQFSIIAYKGSKKGEINAHMAIRYFVLMNNNHNVFPLLTHRRSGSMEQLQHCPLEFVASSLYSSYVPAMDEVLRTAHAKLKAVVRKAKVHHRRDELWAQLLSPQSVDASSLDELLSLCHARTLSDIDMSLDALITTMSIPWEKLLSVLIAHYDTMAREILTTKVKHVLILDSKNPDIFVHFSYDESAGLAAINIIQRELIIPPSDSHVDIENHHISDIVNAICNYLWMNTLLQ